MVEIPSMHVLVVSDLNKKVIFWDITRGQCVQELTLACVSVHTLAYSLNFQVLLFHQIYFNSYSNRFCSLQDMRMILACIPLILPQ